MAVDRLAQRHRLIRYWVINDRRLKGGRKRIGETPIGVDIIHRLYCIHLVLRPPHLIGNESTHGTVTNKDARYRRAITDESQRGRASLHPLHSESL